MKIFLPFDYPWKINLWYEYWVWSSKRGQFETKNSRIQKNFKNCHQLKSSATLPVQVRLFRLTRSDSIFVWKINFWGLIKWSENLHEIPTFDKSRNYCLESKLWTDPAWLTGSWPWYRNHFFFIIWWLCGFNGGAQNKWMSESSSGKNQLRFRNR